MSGYAEFGGGSRRSVYPASAFAQRRFNDLLLLTRKLFEAIESTARRRDRGLSRKPAPVNGESICFAHNDRGLNRVLEFTNVTGPGVGLKQIEAFLFSALKRFPARERPLLQKREAQDRTSVRPCEVGVGRKLVLSRRIVHRYPSFVRSTYWQTESGRS